MPLENSLDVRYEEDGSVRVLHGGTLVAEAASTAQLDVEVPDPVSPEEARVAQERYRGSTEGLFSRCFVCGPAREDALGVFAGNVEGREVVASPWTPPEWTADETGRVRLEFIWAVMDCPTYFAIYRETRPLSFLGRMIARIDAPVAVGAEHVVIAWPISADGRKHQAGAAVLSADGEVLARHRAGSRRGRRVLPGRARAPAARRLDVARRQGRRPRRRARDARAHRRGAGRLHRQRGGRSTSGRPGPSRARGR